jgi:L-serine dehydratase
MFSSVPGKAIIRFYGSLASTWKGHGSGDAVVAGLLGIPPEDERLFRGRAILRDLQSQGQSFPVEIIPVPDLPPSWHPNTMILELFEGQSLGEKESAKGRQSPKELGNDNQRGQSPLQKRLTIRASSVGGGSIRLDEINGYQVNLSGELEAILVLHHDEVGVIADVSHILAAGNINIAATSSHRKEKGDEALLVVETDGAIPVEVLRQIQALSPVYELIRVPSLEGI